MLRLIARGHRSALVRAGSGLLAIASVGCGRHGGEGPPEEVIRHNILGTSYLGQTKWADGEREFRQALELRPKDPLLLTNTAIAVNQQGRSEEAVLLLRRAVTADPTWSQAPFNLGLIETRRGDFAAAARHFAEVERLAPGDLFTRYYLGTSLSRIGREDEALEHLRAALKLDPTHVSTLYVLGRLLLQRGEQDEGMRLIARSQEIRTRSGLDEAIGADYGEQGPYSRAADYPGGALAAPAAVPVRFEAEARIDLQRGSTGLPWTLVPTENGPMPLLLAAQQGSVLQVSPPGRAESRLPPLAGERIVTLAAADVDDDGRVDLALLVEDGAGALAPRLALAAADGTWTPPQPGSFVGETAVRLSAAVAGADLTAVDWNHDGDIDLFWCWTAAGTTGGCRLATNDGAGRIAVRDAAALGIDPRSTAGSVRVAFTDADNDRDIDLLLLDPGGVHLYSNQRDSTFVDVSTDAGLGAVLAGARSVEIADMDKDGFMDLVVGSEAGPLVALNRRGRFAAPVILGTTTAGPAGAGSVLVFDFDDDGFLDVAASSPAGPKMHCNLGAGRFEIRSGPFDSVDLAPDAEPLAARDTDADGDLDLVMLDGRGRLTLLTQVGVPSHHWIALDSRGAGDNHFGIGTKVEILAGALRQKFEITRPLPIHAGLGPRERVQSARYLWPSGVLQDEIDLATQQRLTIAELDRKGTSCPLLYAWRNGRWNFITDFLGGSAIGYQVAPGVFDQPDTDEYVRIDGGLDPDAYGRLKLRLNNQLEEVIWFDKAELIVVDHPAGTEVYPDEKLMPGPPFPAFRLFASADVRPVAAARAVESGLDVTSALSELDRVYVGGFRLLRPKGYAEMHTLELDLGTLPAGRRTVLLLDGWIDYADSSANIAASQAQLTLEPPRLSVADGRGGFVRTTGPMGFPAGLPKTVTIDLTGAFPSGDHRLRIATGMRIYWDRARVMVGGEDTDLHVRRLAPDRAELRFGGFPRETSPDGRPPWAYDPADVELRSPWKTHAGAYTQFGDVTELLAGVDDRFVTTRNGDEIELIFDAPGPVDPGYERTYLLYADGFGKDMDLNSAASDEVAPVPFHGMPSYPYPADRTSPGRGSGSLRPARHVASPPEGWPGAHSPARAR